MTTLAREKFRDILRAKWLTDKKTNYTLLLGAGFSHSAGVPMAKTVAGILATALRPAAPPAGAAAEPWRGALKKFSERKEVAADSLAWLTSTKGPDQFRDMPYNAAYETLLQDDALFPHEAVSRRAFLEVLVKGTDRRRRLFNFEGIYLAEIVDRSTQVGGMLIDTILTTNFDDVIQNSFAVADVTCKTISDTSSITLEVASTLVPRIVHAHGHFSNYYLVNTTDEFRRSRGIDPDIDQSVFDRSKALTELIEAVGSTGGLIVIGYAGWDDVLMDALKAAVAKNCFPAGIYWCKYHNAAVLSENVANLSKVPGFKLIEGVSSIDVMRDLIAAQAIEEGEILESTRRRVARFRELFDHRTIQLEQKRHGLAVSGYPANLYLPAGDWTEQDIQYVMSEAGKALWSGRLAGMALELIDALLSHRNENVDKCEGDLLRYRGLLRSKYCAEAASSTCDLHRALRLNCDKKAETYCGLARNYLSGADWTNWKNSIDAAKKAAKASKDPDDLVAYKIENARWLYFKNRISDAEALLKEAIARYTKTGDFAARAEAYAIFGSMEMFCNNHILASSLAASGIVDAKRAGALNCLWPPAACAGTGASIFARIRERK